VEGKVTVDGEPLAGAHVEFYPIGDTRGTGATARTNKDGHYEIVARHGGPGTPVGDYRVMINKLTMPDGSDFPLDSEVAPIDAGAVQIMPPRYSSRQTTALRAHVPAGGGSVDFRLSDVRLPGR